MKWNTKKKVAGLLFISPWIIGFMVFTVYSLFETVVYSFSKVQVEVAGVKKIFVGLKNFSQVLVEDPDFIVKVPAYIQQIVLFVPMTLVFSILLSLLLNQKLRGRRFFRAVYFLPVILMCGPLLQNIIELDATTINGIKDFILYKFIEQYLPEVISSQLLFIFDNIILILWFCGVQMLIFLSGLQKVDTSVYEAANVDGASGWQQFWKITLPTLKPFILLNAIYAIVDISSSSINPITKMIKESMFVPTKGFGFSAAASYFYFFMMVVFVAAVFMLLGRSDSDTRKREAKERKRDKNEATAMRKATKRKGACAR